MVPNSNNSRSSNVSRNSSFCYQGTINHGAHARKIAQILLSPTENSLPSNGSSRVPSISTVDMVRLFLRIFCMFNANSVPNLKKKNDLISFTLDVLAFF